MKTQLKSALLAIALMILTTTNPATAQSSPEPSSPNGPAKPYEGTIIVAQLQRSIAAKKARIGDLVKADVVQDVVANGRVVIPRWSMLIGHVTQTIADNREEPRSELGLAFDTIAVKHSTDLSVRATLLALAAPAPEPNLMASSSTYGGAQSTGSQPVSGHESGGWERDPRELHGHTRDEALKNASDPGFYGSRGDTLHSGFLGSGNRGVFGMPGVSLKVGGPTSDIVSSKADIKLESGTQMVLSLTIGH